MPRHRVAFHGLDSPEPNEEEQKHGASVQAIVNAIEQSKAFSQDGTNHAYHPTNLTRIQSGVSRIDAIDESSLKFLDFKCFRSSRKKKRSTKYVFYETNPKRLKRNRAAQPTEKNENSAEKEVPHRNNNEGTPSSSKDAQPKTMSVTATRLLQRKQASKSSGNGGHSPERSKRLEEMESREDQAVYNSSRLVARLEILDSYVKNSLSDDLLMAQHELKPWRFRRNKNLQRKWQFVHDAMVTQELISTIREARQRSAAPSDVSTPQLEQRTSPDGESNKLDLKESPVEHPHKDSHTEEDYKDLIKEDEPEDYTNKEMPDGEDKECDIPEENEDYITEHEDECDDKHDVNSTPRCKSPGLNLPAIRPRTMGAKTPKKIKLKQRSKSSLKSSSSSSWGSTVYAFGSSHCRSTCEYCGKMRCAGMRNRGRKGSAKRAVPNSRNYMKERADDIEGIYVEMSFKASNRVRKQLGDRIQQLEKT